MLLAFVHRHLTSTALLKMAIVMTLLAATLLEVPHALAAERHWIGGSSSLWSDGQNWSTQAAGPSCGCTPGVNDAVTFGTGSDVVVVDSPFVIFQNLLLTDAWSGEVRIGVASAIGNITVAGGTIVGGAGTMSTNNYLQTGGVARGFQGNFNVDGDFTVTAVNGSVPVFSLTGALVLNSSDESAQFAVGSGVALDVGGDLIIDDNGSRTFLVGSGALRVGGALTITDGILDFFTNDVRLSVGSGISIEDNANAGLVTDADVAVLNGGIERLGAGTMTLSGTSTLTLGGTASSFDALSGPMYGLVVGASGSITMTATQSVTDSLLIETGATLDIGAHTLAATGASIQNFGLATLTSGRLVQAATGLALADEVFAPKAEFAAGADTVYVTLSKGSANMDGTALDTLTVTGSLANGDVEAIELVETSNVSGLFRGSIDTAAVEPTSANGLLEVASGTSALTVTFFDMPSLLNQTANGMVVVLAPPVLESFTSSAADGTYGPGSDISIVATYDVPLRADSTLDVTMTNGAQLTLDQVSGSTIAGTYTVGVTGSGEDSGDLGVAIIDTENVFSQAGTEQDASSLPAGENLSHNADIIIDTTAPALLTVVPADDASGVAVTANLAMTFDEAVVAGSGKSLTVVQSTSDTTVETIAADGPQVTASGSRVTIVRAVSLDHASGYHVLVESGAWLDAAGNGIAGISSPTAWSFATVAQDTSGAQAPVSHGGGGGGGGGARSSTIAARVDQARATILRRFASSPAGKPAESQASSPAPVAGEGPPAESPPARQSPKARVVNVAERRGRLVVRVEGAYVLYRDVPTTAWFAPYVAHSVENGIAEGYRDEIGKVTGEFGVGNPVTRAELLKMALESAQKPLAAGSPRNASARGTWSAGYVKTAEGIGLSTFAPTVDVMELATRGEVVQTILEVFGFPIADQSSFFSDVPREHRYARAIATAAFYGLVVGDTDQDGDPVSRFRPNDPINRAEVAKLIALIRGSFEP